jgi:hypothetical protein
MECGGSGEQGGSGVRSFPRRRHMLASARARRGTRRLRDALDLASGDGASTGGGGAVKRGAKWREQLGVRRMLIG